MRPRNRGERNWCGRCKNARWARRQDRVIRRERRAENWKALRRRVRMALI